MQKRNLLSSPPSHLSYSGVQQPPSQAQPPSDQTLPPPIQLASPQLLVPPTDVPPTDVPPQTVSPNTLPRNLQVTVPAVGSHSTPLATNTPKSRTFSQCERRLKHRSEKKNLKRKLERARAKAKKLERILIEQETEAVSFFIY